MVKNLFYSKKWNSVIWLFLTIFGTFAIYEVLRSPSETGSAFLFGFSKIRLLILTVTLAIYIIVLLCTISVLFKPPWQQRIDAFIHRLISSRYFPYFFILMGFVLLLGIISLQIVALSQASNEAVILKTILQRIGFTLIWIEIIIFSLFVLFRINFPYDFRRQFSPLKLTILFAILTVFYFATVKVYAFYMWDIRFRNMENYIFLPAVVSIIWAWSYQKFSPRNWYSRVENFLLSITILLVVFVIYRHTSQWMGWQNTPSKAYWNLLADAFLQGRLYLINPSSTHDLTFYQGQWYVPNPPLPAFLVMPFVAFFGVNQINMVVYSIWCGAITILLVFWLLESGSHSGLLPTNRTTNLWLTTLFGFGTCFWWLSVMGRMWFLSQIFTVMFTALAVLFVIKKKSPFLVGAALGFAILARPNVFTVWLFLLSIFIYLDKNPSLKIPWRRMFQWSIYSAFPICVAVAGLLYYNYIRFDDFMDFGYVTITSAEWLTEAVRKYGMFHSHFLPSNFSMMFINYPKLIFENGCLSLSASRDGYSMLIMTPAIIFVFRRFRKNWWFFGAWISVILTISLLLFYHNNGAWQLGYRYLMDFIIPILFLMAVGIGKQLSWVFKSFVLLSIISNFIGIVWWFNKWWC